MITGLKTFAELEPEDKIAVISLLSSILLNTRVQAKKKERGINTSSDRIFLKKISGNNTDFVKIPVAIFCKNS